MYLNIKPNKILKLNNGNFNVINVNKTSVKVKYFKTKTNFLNVWLIPRHEKLILKVDFFLRVENTY